MSIGIAPKFRLDAVLTRLHRDRNYQPATTFAEFFADELLTALKTTLADRGETPTKASLAAAIEDAEQRARQLANVNGCPCGHPFTDHFTSRGGGCFECPCTARRPQAPATTPVPAAAGGTR